MEYIIGLYGIYYRVVYLNILYNIIYKIKKINKNYFEEPFFLIKERILKFFLKTLFPEL